MRRGRGTGRLTAVLLGMTLALVAGPGAAQETPDPRLERIRSELPAPAVERIEAQLARARQQELPVEPILDKAVEGIAKRIAGERIAMAVDQLTGELARARALLQNRRNVPADVAAVADGLRRGVSEGMIRRISEQAGPQEPVGLVVHTVGDLLDQGVPEDRAAAAMDAWRGRGGRPDELRELPAAVERLIRRGYMPAQAAEAVAGAMRGGRGPAMGQQPGMQGQGKGPPGGPPIPPGAGPPDDRGKGKGKGKPPGGGPPGG